MTSQPHDDPLGAADEMRLAEFLEQAFLRRLRGEPVRAAEMLQRQPHLIPAAERLLADARDLFDVSLGLRAQASFFAGEELPPAADEPEAPAQLPDPFPGEFRVRKLLGRGTFGDVWLADDLHIGRPVALKQVRPAGPPAAAVRLDLLREEARLLGAIRHPNVAQVYAWREAGAGGAVTPYLVLQYVPGGSLAGRVRREGPLLWAAAARYVADVAEGLAAVHKAGIVHRDVKPANILWDPQRDEAVLTDFGVSTRLARPGSVAGTPQYMAPEAFDGVAGPPQDVYGLAATLFWLVTGSAPFPGVAREQLAELARRGLSATDPRCALLPAALERLLRAGLAADPAARPAPAAFAAALRGDLNRLLADRLTLRPSPPPAVGLRITVSVRVEPHTYLPVATSRPGQAGTVRDMEVVPAEPEEAELRTGQRVRLEVEAGRRGFVTVFNVGTTGNLHVLHPRPGAAAPAEVGPARPLALGDIGLTPPAGAERVFVLWTREPLPLRPEELRTLAERGTLPGSYLATRDLEWIQDSVQRLGPDDWCVAVLNLRHLAPEENAR
jgi:serine/threonine protein kinase